jgi:hypothetical protein
VSQVIVTYVQNSHDLRSKNIIYNGFNTGL